MFVRARNYTTKNGEQRRNFALVQAQHVNGKPRNTTLLNLGKDFKIVQQKFEYEYYRTGPLTLPPLLPDEYLFHGYVLREH